MKEDWLAEAVERWKAAATDYPTKALLHTAYRMFEEEKQRLEQEKGKLDGMVWKREEWD